ncbi:DNA/RNA helicase domain-containing protein [Nocardia salmonicida]
MTSPAWGSDRLVQVPGLPVKNHPVDQARGYCEFLTNYVAVLHARSQSVHGLVYLHNATRASVRNLFDRQPDKHGQLFTGSEDADLVAYLRERIKPAPEVVDELLNSDIRRRGGFFDTAREVLRGRSPIALLDNQRLAVAAVLNEIEQANAPSNVKKRIVVVTGGPGSGKSAIAIDIMNKLRGTRHRVVHATGSGAFTTTLRKYSDKRDAEVNALFTYFMQIYAKHKDTGVEVLICDEAHRLRRVSDGPRVKKSGLSQIDELVKCARVPVFFLDEQQAVRPDEVGTMKMIREYADHNRIHVRHVELEDQFRCGASVDYLDWVSSLLGLRPGAYPTWWRGDDFDVRIASTPQEMEDFLQSRVDVGETARMMAGFCWEWNEPLADQTLPNDVVIDSWARPWNKKGPKPVPSAPHSEYWATDPRGFGQIGCTYTAQGFDFDWAGVILGPDIALGVDGRLDVDSTKNCDKPLKGTKNKPVFDEDAERLIRNAYYVLLTRGLRGVMIYAVDPALRDLLHELVKGGPRRRASVGVVEL